MAQVKKKASDKIELKYKRGSLFAETRVRHNDTSLVKAVHPKQNGGEIPMLPLSSGTCQSQETYLI